MRSRKQTLRKEIQDLNQLRADLEDQVSTFSGNSTLVSNNGRPDATAVPPSVDLTDRTASESPDQTPSTSPSPSQPTQSSVDVPSVVQLPAQPAKTVTWRDPTTDDCPIARPLSDNIDPRSHTNTTILHPINSAPNTIPHSPLIVSKVSSQSVDPVTQVGSKTRVRDWLSSQSTTANCVSTYSVSLNSLPNPLPTASYHFPSPFTNQANFNLSPPTSLNVNAREFRFPLNKNNGPSYHQNPLTHDGRTNLNSFRFDNDVPPQRSRPHASTGNPYLQSFGNPSVSAPELRHNSIDAVANFLLRKELEPANSAPFEGEAHKFYSWLNKMNAKFSTLHLTAQQKINMLECNTKGEPQMLIRDFQDVCPGDPEFTLQRIYHELQTRFGSPEAIFNEIDRCIAKQPFIKDNHDLVSLRNLLHLCRLIECNLRFVQSLTCYDTPSGLKKIWLKLPYSVKEGWTRLVSSRARQGLPVNFHAMIDHIEEHVQNLSHSQFYHNDLKKSQKDCSENVVCIECKSQHISAMHDSARKHKTNVRRTDDVRDSQGSSRLESSTLCTQTCNSVVGKSCLKVLLVEVWSKESREKVKCYALLDEQSSASFISSKLADRLKATGLTQEYSLTTLTGCQTSVKSMEVKNLMIKGVGEKAVFPLPKLLTNDYIPNCKEEIGTPEIVSLHPRIRKYAKHFNKLEPNANVHLLLGRDSNDILRTTCYGDHYPYVHHTAIGWALVGSACPNLKVQKDQHQVLRTAVSHEHWEVPKPKFSQTFDHKTILLKDTFATLPDDELPFPSTAERRFLEIVENETTTDEEGSLVIQLPFKEKCSLPNNKNAVYTRTRNTLQRLKLDPDKLGACVETMTKYRDAGHVEQIDPEEPPPSPGRSWYLPIFPVVHKKKGKTRLVFDSSAKYKGASLNDFLLQGPNNNNRLKGVLLRFRNGPFAVSCDIEMMFHSFKLPKEDRNYVRFFFFRDLDPAKELTEYRMKSHCFGNTASPEVA